MNVDVKKIAIKELLTDDFNYRVPIFQRSFAWGNEQITDLWDDLNQILKEKDDDYSHFLGSMVFTPGSHERILNILDGQQRFASILLLINALRDILKASTMVNSFQRTQILSTYLSKADPISLEIKPKMTMNREDEEFFNKFISGITVVSNVKSHKLLNNAYNFFIKEINEILNNCPDEDSQEVYIKRILTAILDKFLIIRIEVDSDTNAHMLFETLNDRGLELSVADLVKNYLLSIKTDNTEPLFENWMMINNHIGESNLNKFLRHYWISSKELVRKDDLYKKLKNEVNAENVKEFIKNLANEAEIYSNLKSPNHEFWQDTEIEDLLDELRTLRVEIVYSVLLAVYKRYYDGNKRVFKELLQKIIAFSFRYHTICKMNPNETERLYGNISSKIRNEEISEDEFLDKLRELNPSSEIFIESFGEMEIKTAKLAKYILINANNYLLKTSGKEEITTNIKRVNLEHIIPKNPDKDWWKFFKKQEILPDELIHKIGNMTILLSAYNSKIRNNYFTKKLATYKISELPLNVELSKFEVFGPEEVAIRSKQIASIADNLWSV